MNINRIYTVVKKAISNLPVIVKIYIVIAILAPVLANEKPLAIKINGEFYFPAFSNQPYISIRDKEGSLKIERRESLDWATISNEFILRAPISWSPAHSDLENANYVSPFSNQYFIDSNGTKKELPFFRRHFLGTTRSGEDVLAGLIHGARVSISIGFTSMFIAGLLGLLIGGVAGYFGDYNLKMRRLQLLYSLIMIVPAWYYAFVLQSQSIHDSFSFSIVWGTFRFIASMALFGLILFWPLFFPGKTQSKNYFLEKISIPIDFLIMRVIELFLSMPRMILILTIAAMSRPSAGTLILIIGMTSWTEIARITRAEILKLREVDFILAEKSIGLKINSILFNHILPNIIPIILTVLIFGVASAIMLETGLSFLGIGLPAGTATWGSLMFAAKENFMAWWLVLFPGMAIALLLTSLNKMGKSSAKIQF